MTRSRLVRLTVIPTGLILIVLAGVFVARGDSLSAPVPHTLVKGLAQLNWSHNEDRATLGVTQYYAWGMNSCGTDFDHCTPMNRNWAISAQTFCPPRELVGNEPTNDEPAGHPISPHDAVTSTLAIAALCPDTQLIVANIFGLGQPDTWLTAYLAEYKALSGHEYGTIAHIGGLFDLVGFHVYSNSSENGIDQAMSFMKLGGYRGHFWVTEFHVTDYYDHPGAWKEFALFLKWLGLQPRVDRVYAWTNRLSEPEWNLVNVDGTLTAEGQQYHDWQPAGTVWQSQFPLLHGAAQGYP